MAVAAQAALLDELMGKGRNVSLSEAKPPHWSDDDMCKYYLAGLCPHDLFNNTKDDLGPCEKAHDCSLLNNYRKSKRCGEMRYEEQLCQFLRDLISNVESRIRRGQARLQKNGNLVHSFYNCEREEVLQDLTGKIEETLIKVEKLGTDGEVEQSRVWLDVAEKLKNEKIRMEKSIEIYNQQAKELEICQICGAFQVKGDAHQRIEEHLQGKMHLGYALIREYLASHNNIKVSKNVKVKMPVSSEPIKSKGNGCTDDNNKTKEHIKVENEEQDKNNEKYRERIKKEEEAEDCECTTQWGREQSKVKERHESHKDNSKERRRKRSRSKEKHRHNSRKHHRRSHGSVERSIKHSKSQRRSKTPKRHVHK